MVGCSSVSSSGSSSGAVRFAVATVDGRFGRVGSVLDGGCVIAGVVISVVVVVVVVGVVVVTVVGAGVVILTFVRPFRSEKKPPTRPGRVNRKGGFRWRGCLAVSTRAQRPFTEA